ncbi:MAG: DNA-3-methyladenine glycosylase family protein [Kiloniellales bacterium]
MVSRINESSLRRGMAALAVADPDLARLRRLVGPPGLRVRRPGFAALLNILVAQQLSRASAEAIWRRLEAACRPAFAEAELRLRAGRPLTARTLLGLSDHELRAIGLSRPKVAHAQGLAQAVAGRGIDLARIASQDDQAAIAALMTLKGIGRWSAEIYLLSALGRPAFAEAELRLRAGRPDVWPADDLALMVAVQRLKRLDERPTRAVMERIAEPWRPWRSVAARLLWHYYRHGPDARSAA